MVKNGKELGEDSIYGSALVEFGESLHQMADVKYALEDNCKQNFLDPLYNLQTKDLREVTEVFEALGSLHSRFAAMRS